MRADNKTGQAWSRSDRLRLLAALILLAGLCWAAFVYATSTDAPGEGIGYQQEGGETYTVLPTDSRSYQRSLEYYGGKSGVMMTELRQWFSGLWHGASLAVIIACATAVVAGGCLYASGEEPDEPDR